jgi:hypothetical protein
MNGETGAPWSRDEVDAIVADYLHMLVQELAGQSYNKTAHRRALQQKLRGRSEGSIERKHQNISAVLIELGCPYIGGYKPLANYQQLLFDAVVAQLQANSLLDRSATLAAERPATVPLIETYDALLVEAPSARVAEQRPAKYETPARGVKRDYLALEASNRSLGEAGELFVLAYEKFRLHAAGMKKLGDRVEHVSSTKGDGLGFDIASFDLDGYQRFIEVKTTTFGKETPFYVTRNEVEFAAAHAKQFHLYRLFEFRQGPRMFDLTGDIAVHVRLDPCTYLARFS